MATAQNTTFYSLEHVIAVFAGHTVEGFGDGDGITFPNIQGLNTTVDAHGNINATVAGEYGGDIMITLSPAAPSLPFFMRYVRRALRGRHRVWPAEITFMNGAHYVCRGGVMKEYPTGPTLGKNNTGNVNFSFQFRTIDPNWDNVRLTNDNYETPTPPAGGNLRLRSA